MSEEIDYQRVDNNLLYVITQLNGIANQIATLNVPGTARFVDEIDIFRKQLAIEVRKQGTAS